MSFAQIYTFEQIGIEDGLSQNMINAIEEDQYGFLWFGTWDGLNRYDGYEFETFKHKAFDTSSLSSNVISDIHCDSKGRIWIGTSGGGLNQFIPDSKTFKTFNFNPFDENALSNNSVNVIHEDRFGRIVIGTEFGLNVIFEDNSLQSAQIVSFFFSKGQNNNYSNNIQSILNVEEGLLIGTDKGIILFDMLDQNQFSYRKVNTQIDNFEIEPNVNCMYRDSLDRIWIGTSKGLYKTHSFSDNLKLERVTLSNTDEEDDILFIDQDAKGNMWVSSSNRGLFTSSEDLKFNEVQDDIINDSFKDLLKFQAFYQNPKQDIVWIGTDLEGLKKLSRTGRNFESVVKGKNKGEGILHDAVFSTYSDDEGNTWIGTLKGFGVSNDLKNFYNYSNIEGKINPISKVKIRNFEKDREDNLWIASVDGLCKIDLTKTSIEKIRSKGVKLFFKEDYPGLASNYIYDVHEDRNGVIWIATDRGLSIYNRERNRFKRINYLPDKYFNQGALAIKTIYEDLDGNIWLCTNGGLHRITKRGSAFEYGYYHHNPLNREGICSNEVNHIVQSKSGDYWIATAHGLNKLSIENGKANFEYFNREDGLPNEYLYAIFEDDNDNLWISSNNGIIRYDPDEGSFLNFVKEDGIQGNEFNVGSFHKSRDGKILFGGISGLTIFYPGMIDENENMPKVYVTSIKENGEEIYSFYDIQNMEEGNSIDFEYDQNSLSIDFVALDYMNPSRNQYSYYLEGNDRKWVNLGNKKTVNFSGLSPGDYTLHIRGSNNNGIWSEVPARLNFKIIPPFWQRAEFYALVLILAIGVSYLFYRRNLNKKIAQIMKIEKLKLAMNEDIRRKAAADFHDEMGHYLTRINVLTEILKQRLKDTPNEINGLVSSIGEQSQKLYNGTRDFIWTINPDNNTIYELAIRLKDFGDEMTVDLNINFQILGLNDNLRSKSLTTDNARQLVLIFKEAINNAVKHSGADEIVLSFEELEGEELPQVVLRDNGKGFESLDSGSGNGIQNMRKRAKKLGSQIEFINLQDGGCMVKLYRQEVQNLKSRMA